MKIPAEKLNPRETAPKDRVFLLYCPPWKRGDNEVKETVDVVEWCEQLGGFLAMGLASRLRWAAREIEPEQFELIEDECWTPKTPISWFWAECSDLIQ